MIILIGAFIVFGSVIGGFLMAGGHVPILIQPSEYVLICGSALGAMIIMAPKKVLKDMLAQVIVAFKGTPFKRDAYNDMFKALYEMFMLARRSGMVALEEHVVSPSSSGLLAKYPAFTRNHHAIEFLCGALRPIVDGKLKPDQLKGLLDTELETLENEHHLPVSIMTKAADAMPGFGIVAAVLGIVVTMGSISGPVEEIGHHVAAALVGTFLGILISYGFLNPLAVNMEITGASELAYLRCLATAVTGFANGLAPAMALEAARRSLTSEVRPSADELEAMLKAATSQKSPEAMAA
ncbi:MAG: hypothetical protein RJA22_2606 [Verrucomicrobiota bacterium]|jgi:chemotaxis protein MotA